MNRTLLITLFISLLSIPLLACDGTSVTVISNTDNGDGTYTLDFTVCFEPGDMMGTTDQLTLDVNAGSITSFSPQNITFTDGTVLYGGQLSSNSIQWQVSGFDWVSSGAPDQCYDVTLVVDQNPEGYYANVGPNCIHSETLPTPCVTPSEPSAIQNYTFCMGESIPDFSATSNNGNTINWYDSDQTTILTTGSTATAASLNISSSSSSSFSFYLAQSDGNCESPLLPVTVTVEAAADASFSSFGPLCEAESAVSLSSLVTGTLGGTFTVNGVNQTTFDPANQGPGSFTVEYTVGSGSCQDVHNTLVTVNPSDDASWTNIGPICEGESVITLSSLVTGTQGGTFTIDGNVSTQLDPSVLGVGSYSVEYSVGSGVCAQQQIQQLNVVASANSTVTSPGDVCLTGSSFDLNNYVQGDLGGVWTGNNINGSTFDPTSFSSAQTTQVTYTVGSGSCLSSSTVDINLLYSPDPTFIVSSGCEGNNFELEHTGEVSSSTIFNWDFDGLNGYGQGTGVYDLGYPNQGSYNVSLSVSDGSCVSSIYSQTIEVYPQPELNVAVADESCFGACDGVVILTPTNGTFNNAPNYTWNTGLSVGTATNLCAGSYTVEVSDDNSCTSNYEFEVSSPEELVVNVVSQDVSCNGMNDGNAYLDVYGGTPGYYYTWSNGEITTDINSLTAGTYSVEVQDALGCTYTETFTLTEPNSITNGEEVDVDPESLIVGSETLLSVEDNFDSYSWFVDGENMSSESFHSVSFDNAGTYPVYVIVEVAGCYDTLQTSIEVQDLFAVYVPNAFTPGDVDGVNDNFQPVVSVDNIDEYELRVFNRWGELVFETTDPYQSWDGTSQSGNACKQDVYVYQLLVVKGVVKEAYSTIGEVTLFR